MATEERLAPLPQILPGIMKDAGSMAMEFAVRLTAR
jgi:hypothetical protein